MTSSEMPSIQNYLDDIEEKDRILSHRGPISSASVDYILSKSEKHLQSIEDLKIQKRVFGILVEVLQNILKHGSNFQNKKDDESCIVLIKRKMGYSIFAGNYVDESAKARLKKEIEYANSLDSDEIKNYYRDKLDTGELSEKGGAGLGLIDIVRKSGTRLNYWFEEVNNRISLFCLEVHINM